MRDFDVYRPFYFITPSDQPGLACLVNVLYVSVLELSTGIPDHSTSHIDGDSMNAAEALRRQTERHETRAGFGRQVYLW